MSMEHLLLPVRSVRWMSFPQSIRGRIKTITRTDMGAQVYGTSLCCPSAPRFVPSKQDIPPL